MKKRTAIILSSLTLAICSIYFINGKLIQKTYYESIATLNARENVQINLAGYKRGIFTTQASVQLELVGANGELEIIPLQQRITHGPVIFGRTGSSWLPIRISAARIRTLLSDNWQEKLVSYTTNKQPFSLTTFISFDQNAESFLDIAENKPASDSEVVKVSWGRIRGQIEHSLDFGNYNGQILVPNLQVGDAQSLLTLENITINLDAGIGARGFGTNNQLLNKLLSFKRNQVELLRLTDIKSEFRTSNQGDNLSISLYTEIADSVIVHQQFGAEKFLVEASNINREALGAVSKYSLLTPKSLLDFVQRLTLNSNDFKVEVPKEYTQALLSYISFELYRGSLLGQQDKRPELVIFRDVSNSVNKLMQTAVKQRLFIDQGTVYALNFNRR